VWRWIHKMQMFKDKKGAGGLTATLGSAGIIVVLVLGLMQGFGVNLPPMLVGILVFVLILLGLVIGFMSLGLGTIPAIGVIVAVTALGLGAGILSSLGILGDIFSPVLSNLTILVIPIAFVVAVGLLINLLKN